MLPITMYCDPNYLCTELNLMHDEHAKLAIIYGFGQILIVANGHILNKNSSHLVTLPLINQLNLES